MFKLYGGSAIIKSILSFGKSGQTEKVSHNTVLSNIVLILSISFYIVIQRERYFFPSETGVSIVLFLGALFFM